MPAVAAPVPQDGGRIVGDYTGRCLDSDWGGTKGQNGSIVQLWDCNGNAWQRWVITADGHIKSRYDGRCLDADGNGTRNQNGAIIQLWDCNANAWQRWTVGTDMKIRSQYNGRCLDADRNGTKSQQGALIQLWDCNANSWQSWPNSLFRLGGGERLQPGEALIAGGYQVEMQTDGNVVVYGPGHIARWATATGQSGSVLDMQSDGNLVLYGPGNVPLWDTGTNQTSSTLDMQSDGNLVVYNASRVPVWDSNTAMTVQPLASTILANSQITLLNFHVSGNFDPASTARQNIIDSSRSRMATRSSYGSAPGGRVWLHPNMLNAPAQLGAEGALRVTAIAGSQHSANSKHYSGRAFDLDQYGGRSISTIVNRCYQLGASLAQFETNHVHCEWTA